MKTRFDHISDKKILAVINLPTKYSDIPDSHDCERIAWMAREMATWKAWAGRPVTYYEGSGLNFDGHHRVRAAKFVATQCDYQILIPVRYSTIMGGDQ